MTRMVWRNARAGDAAHARRPLRLAQLTASLLGVALALTGCGGSHSASSVRPAPQAGPAAHRAASAAKDAGRSIVASALTRQVSVYHSPTSRDPFLRLANPTSVGEPLVFLVKQRGPAGWEQVYLPMRPNESTGWIRDRDVSLKWDSYSVQVRLSAHRLIVRNDGKAVARFPAAVGRSVLPTPHGRYFVVDLLKQPNPKGPYGPYAFGTSAFSTVLYSFGGGPGQIGIHGTNEPASIGHGASHGCIRLANRDIVRLAHLLPLGTPVTIEG